MAECSHVSPGSSPLARGTHGDHRGVLVLLRFIPARAGNTAPRSVRSAPLTVHPRSRGEHCAFGTPRRSAKPVHPRSRGEHIALPATAHQTPGSSPLARGTQPRRGCRHGAQRFIPARAGNTNRDRSSCASGPVHPRSRGEHTATIGASWCFSGSSPLARGTHMLKALTAAEGRFIPARAGNTTAPATTWRATPVHPRSRGEHRISPTRSSGRRGSSPLARGTPWRWRQPRPCGRFIPARAGNTKYRSPEPPPQTVHPRSRGEHPRSASSPPWPRHRFIPARAGNTGSSWLTPASSTVHPRSRGEHQYSHGDRSSTTGSSPLARGTRCPKAMVTLAGEVHPRSRGEHASDTCATT